MARSELKDIPVGMLLTHACPNQPRKTRCAVHVVLARGDISHHVKATEYHLGLLKAKLARYRAQLLEPTAKSGAAGTGFDVQKSGDARVALIGFPSVGKVFG